MSAADDPQITTVIPTYRRPHLLRRAVESVLAQTYPHLRVAVFDNASGDETAEVVAGLARRDPRVRYYRHPENLGPVANFQAGMDSVDTPYFSFLSDDDILLPGFYEHALECLHHEPRARLFCGQTVIYDSEQGSHYVKPTRPWRTGLYEPGQVMTQLIETGFIWTGLVFVSEIRTRMGQLEEIGTFDTLFVAKSMIQFPFVVSLVPCAIRTDWSGRMFDALSADQVGRAYRTITEQLARLPGVSAEHARHISTVLERKRWGIFGRRLRLTFMSGDWSSFDLAAEFLREQGKLSYGKRMRIFLAKRRERIPILIRMIQKLLRQQQKQRAARRSGRPLGTVEDLVRFYSAVAAGRTRLK